MADRVKVQLYPAIFENPPDYLELNLVSASRTHLTVVNPNTGVQIVIEGRGFSYTGSTPSGGTVDS